MKNNKQLTRIINGMQIHAADINNTIIKMNSIVTVPAPAPDDIWSFEFQATVIDYLENGDILVKDADGDVFQMVPHIVEIVEDNQESEDEEVARLKDEKNGLYPDKIDIAN